MSYVDGGKTRGGKSYSQKLYVKQKIRERDNYTCQLCGKSGYDVDHITPWHISHDSTLSNLRVLCRSCNQIGRRQTSLVGRMRCLPDDEWVQYLKEELAKCRTA